MDKSHMPKFATQLRRRQIDAGLSKFKAIPKPPDGYIRQIRNALGMSMSQLAGLLGITQPSVAELEKNERNGSITLNSLERVATALNCRFIYAFVPTRTLEDIVEEKAREQAEALSKGIFRTMALEQQSTTKSDQEALISALAQEILRKGGPQLWKKHDR